MKLLFLASLRAEYGDGTKRDHADFDVTVEFFDRCWSVEEIGERMTFDDTVAALRGSDEERELSERNALLQACFEDMATREREREAAT